MSLRSAGGQKEEEGSEEEEYLHYPLFLFMDLCGQGGCKSQTSRGPIFRLLLSLHGIIQPHITYHRSSPCMGKRSIFEKVIFFIKKSEYFNTNDKLLPFTEIFLNIQLNSTVQLNWSQVSTNSLILVRSRYRKSKPVLAA